MLQHFGKIRQCLSYPSPNAQVKGGHQKSTNKNHQKNIPKTTLVNKNVNFSKIAPRLHEKLIFEGPGSQQPCKKHQNTLPKLMKNQTKNNHSDEKSKKKPPFRRKINEKSTVPTKNQRKNNHSDEKSTKKPQLRGKIKEKTTIPTKNTKTAMVRATGRPRTSQDVHFVANRAAHLLKISANIQKYTLTC